jgi:hypothetical protein
MGRSGFIIQPEFVITYTYVRLPPIHCRSGYLLLTRAQDMPCMHIHGSARIYLDY